MIVLNLNKSWKESVDGETYLNRRYVGEHNTGVGLFWVDNKEKARVSILEWASVNTV